MMKTALQKLETTVNNGNHDEYYEAGDNNDCSEQATLAPTETTVNMIMLVTAVTSHTNMVWQ